MIKIKNFKPDSNTEAGLKDQISFIFSELSNTLLQAGQSPTDAQRLPPEGQHEFTSLSDLEIVDILNQANSQEILFYNPDQNTSSAKNTIKGISLPKATQQEIIEEKNRVTPYREQVRQNLSYIARLTFPFDTTEDPQQKQAINFYDTQDSSINYTLASKGKVLDIAQTISENKAYISDKAFTGFIQPTAQLLFSRIIKLINPGQVINNIPFLKIQWYSQNLFKLYIEGDLTDTGVGRQDKVKLTGCFFELIPGLQATVESVTIVEQQPNIFNTEIIFSTNLVFSPITIDSIKYLALNQGNLSSFNFVDSQSSWVLQTSFEQKPWTCVAFDPITKKLAATAYNNYIYTSSDLGTTWVELTSSGQKSWTSVAFSPDGTKLVASAADDYIYISSDSGLTWTALTSSGKKSWTSVVFHPSIEFNNSTLVASAFNDNIYISSNLGATWTAKFELQQKPWTCVAFDPITKKLAATAYNNYIYTSSDLGTTWVELTSSGQKSWTSVAFSPDGTKLVASAADDYIYISSDSGLTWSEQTSFGKTFWSSVLLINKANTTSSNNDVLITAANFQKIQQNNLPITIDQTNNLTINNTTSTIDGVFEGSTAKPKAVVTNYSAISNSPILSIIFPAGSYNTVGKLRDVLFCSVESLYNYPFQNKAVVSLIPSNFSPSLNMEGKFFNDNEIVGINGNGNVTEGNRKQGRDILPIDLALAVSGYPILAEASVNNSILSLSKINNFIKNEIPQTRIYKPLVKNEEFFLGNLLKSTVAVYLTDDDKQVALVSSGQANPGASIEYKLLTDPENYYDVQATITLFASPIRIPISGPASSGANAIKVSVSISSNKSILLQTGLVGGNNASTSNKQTTQSEYYFNKEAVMTGTKEEKKIKLNTYGTIRILDSIRILERDQQGNFREIQKNTVKGILEKDSLIILTNPLNQSISPTGDTKYFVEIPQTPLNPNRKYGVKVFACDRGGNIV